MPLTLDVYVHAPYRINVATTNNRVRIPSRKLLLQHAQAAAELGARGLIVHGGHVDKGADMHVGFDNWRKTFAYAADNGGFPLPILIENTAGGDNACARRFDALARLWDAVGEYEVGLLPGHLPRACRRRGAAGHRRPGEGHHRPDRPGARQRLQGQLRLRRRPPPKSGPRADRRGSASSPSSGRPARRPWWRRRQQVTSPTSPSYGMACGDDALVRTAMLRAASRSGADDLPDVTDVPDAT